MRDDAAIARYVRKAVIFWRNNPTAGLFHLANFLGAAANTELNRLGVPDVKVRHQEHGARRRVLPRGWLVIVVNGLTRERSGDTLGERDEDDAAIVAMTSSTRRVTPSSASGWRACRRARGGARLPMDEDAAEAAAAQPLDPRRMPAQRPRGEGVARNPMARTPATARRSWAWQSEVKRRRGGSRVACQGEARSGGAARADRPEPHGWIQRRRADGDPQAPAERRSGARTPTIIADITLMHRRFDAAVGVVEGDSRSSRRCGLRAAGGCAARARQGDRRRLSQPAGREGRARGRARDLRRVRGRIGQAALIFSVRAGSLFGVGLTPVATPEYVVGARGTEPQRAKPRGCKGSPLRARPATAPQGVGAAGGEHPRRLGAASLCVCKGPRPRSR